MFKIKFFNNGFPKTGEKIDNEKFINEALAEWKNENEVNIVAVSPFNYRNSNVIALCVMYTEKESVEIKESPVSVEPTIGSMQTAMVLDELPPEVLAEIELHQESLKDIESALRNPDVKLAGYFRDITDPEEQVKFAAVNILYFFENRRNRKK